MDFCLADSLPRKNTVDAVGQVQERSSRVCIADLLIAMNVHVRTPVADRSPLRQAH
jgi:hypothetical protein